MASPMTWEEELAAYRARPRRGRVPRPIEPRACHWDACGSTFTPTEKRNARYCSKSCGMKASHARGDRAAPGGTIADKARAAGVPADTVYQRRMRGWSLDRALATPPARKGTRPEGSNFGGWR